MKSAILLNDTRRETGHKGCDTVVKSILALASKNSLEIKHTLQSIDNKFSESFFEEIISNVGTILINGEGTLHHNSGEGIFRRIKIAKNLGKKIFVFNTVWQSNDITKDNLDYIDRVWVRESLSEKELRRDNSSVNVTTVPDLSIWGSRNIVNSSKPSSDPCGILFTDSNYHNVTIDLLLSAFKHNCKFKFMSPYRFKGAYDEICKNSNVNLANFKKYCEGFCSQLDDQDILNHKLLVTGRFHASCFSVTAGIPFIAIPSNTHKIEGLIDDIGLSRDAHLIKSCNENIFTLHSDAYVDKFKLKCLEYCTRAEQLAESCFEEIARSAI